LCSRNKKKIKATAAKVAKVDGAGMVLFLKQLITIAHNADGNTQFVFT
jgi:hypothetical protein